MFVKFDKAGNTISYSTENNLDKIMPDNYGFEKVPFDVDIDDAYFLIKKNNIILIDVEKKEQSNIL